MCHRENTDVCIQCEESKFYCHSVILKARSLWFARILASHSEVNVVEVSEVNHYVMEKIITFIYTGQVNFNKDNLVEVIAASVKLEVHTLLDECHRFFRNQINFENAADVLILAEKFQLPKFQEVALKRITKNRISLMSDQQFRQKMLDHPRILLLLYDDVCQDQHDSQSAVEVSTGPLWSCSCGSTISGQFCCWCG